MCTNVMSGFKLFRQQSGRNRKPDLVRAFLSLRYGLLTTHAGSHDVEGVRKDEMHAIELPDGTCVTHCGRSCINGMKISK